MTGDAVVAYGRAAEAWASGPHRMYRRLSEALLAASPAPLTASLALDLGAGTGAASEALTELGARPVALDAAVGMLLHDRRNRPPAVAGDAYWLPIRAGVFDAVVAAFVLNHLDDPVAALAEAARVTRRGGLLLAATFEAGWEHPAKEHVEAAAAELGWRRPAWYRDLKTSTAPAIGEPEAFASAAAVAGWAGVNVMPSVVDTGLHTPGDLVGWRLGMAQFASFVATLDDEARARLWQDALRRVTTDLQPLRPHVLFCVALSRY